MSKCEKFSYLKVKNLKAKNICAQNIRAQNTKTDNLEVQSIVLNGKDITCDLFGTPIEAQNVQLDPMDEEGRPLRPPRVNEAVFNALLCNAELELQASQERATRGRGVIQQFEAENQCAQCGYTGGVPMSIYGYITKPLLNVKQCGVTGGTGANVPRTDITVIQRMSYNLEVDYDVTVAQSTQARLCTVLCHLAFMDPPGSTGPSSICSGPTGDCGMPVCGPIFVQEIVIGNKQFYPTIDDLYGEMFSGDAYVDTDLAELAAAAMPDPNNSAAVQLVFFVEEGLTIWSPQNARGNESETINTPGNVGEVPLNNRISCGPDQVACVRGGVPICLQRLVPSFTFEVVPTSPFLTVNFTSTTTGTPGETILYNWNFGDGSPASGQQSPTHIYASANTYTVVLTVRYAINCDNQTSLSTSQQVEVGVAP